VIQRSTAECPVELTDDPRNQRAILDGLVGEDGRSSTLLMPAVLATKATTPPFWSAARSRRLVEH
jgi:hypothetical protein